MNAKRQFPDESVVNSSSSVIVGGLVLAFGAVLLAVGLTQATHLKGLFYRHRSTWGASFRVIESTAVFLSCWLLLSGVFMVMRRQRRLAHVTAFKAVKVKPGVDVESVPTADAPLS